MTPRPDAPTETPTRKLLVVDDEEGIRMVLQRLLARLPAKPAVDAASSAEEALAMLERSPYTLIITDFNMGGRNGVFLLAAAKERWPETIRLLMTGYTDAQIEADARGAGSASAVVHKPWNNQALLQLVAKLLSESDSSET